MGSTGRRSFPSERLNVASKASITIRVTASRGASRVQYTTKGRYVSFPVNGLSEDLARQPIQPTASAEVFWASVLNLVLTELETSASTSS